MLTILPTVTVSTVIYCSISSTVFSYIIHFVRFQSLVSKFMTVLHCQTCSSEYSACTRTNKEITILFMFLSFFVCRDGPKYQRFPDEHSADMNQVVQKAEPVLILG